MTTDDLKTGSAPIRKRQPSKEREREASTRVSDLDPVTPDAVSPVARSNTSGTVPGDLTPDTGLGAACGRDRGGPGGREHRSRDAGDVPGRAVDSDPKD